MIAHQPSTHRELISKGAAALAVISSLLFVLETQGLPRQAATIAFLLFVPGWSLAVNLNLGDPVLEIGLAVGASVALAVILALLMLALGVWSPLAAYLLLAAGSLAGLAKQRSVPGRHAVNAIDRRLG